MSSQNTIPKIFSRAGELLRANIKELTGVEPSTMIPGEIQAKGPPAKDRKISESFLQPILCMAQVVGMKPGLGWYAAWICVEYAVLKRGAGTSPRGELRVKQQDLDVAYSYLVQNVQQLQSFLAKQDQILRLEVRRKIAVYLAEDSAIPPGTMSSSAPQLANQLRNNPSEHREQGTLRNFNQGISAPAYRKVCVRRPSSDGVNSLRKHLSKDTRSDVDNIDSHSEIDSHSDNDSHSDMDHDSGSQSDDDAISDKFELSEAQEDADTEASLSAAMAMSDLEDASINIPPTAPLYDSVPIQAAGAKRGREEEDEQPSKKQKI